MDYLTEHSVFWYNQNRINQQIDFEEYVNECVILAEAKDVISRLRIFNEEEKTGIGEKIKNGFKKFIEFIKRIWAKWIDKMTRFVSGNKKWLDKNRAIILNNPFKFESITIYNYEEGIKKMVNSKVPEFNYDQIKDSLGSDADAANFVAHAAGNTTFKYVDEDTNLGSEMQDYYRGGDEQIEIPKAKINLSDMYNYCYTYDKMKDKIQKDKTTLENAINKITKITTDRAIKKETNTSAQTSDNTPPVTTGNEQNVSSSYVFSAVYNTYVAEADGPTVTGKPDHEVNKDDTVKAPSVKTGVVGDKEATAAKNVQNVAGNPDDRDKIQAQNTDTANTTDDAADMQQRCIRYQNYTSAVLSAKLTVSEQCYKHYLKILIAHVDSYTGRKQANNRAASVASDYREGDPKNPSDTTPSKIEWTDAQKQGVAEYKNAKTPEEKTAIAKRLGYTATHLNYIASDRVPK